MAETQQADPFQVWRDWISQSERQWNSFLNEAMATDEFGQAMGRMMDVYLNMQQNLNEVMGRYFSVLNLPTRTDVLSLANRLAEIEERLMNIEQGLQDMAPAEKSRQAKAAPVKRPARTKKPATS